MGMGPFLPFLSWVYFKNWWIRLKFTLAGLESKLIEIDDGATTIHCWVPKEEARSKGGASADGRPALLLIQGFGMNGIFGWEKQVPAFAKKFRVYVPDLVFFGQSTTTANSRSENFQGDCFKKMLDALGVHQAHVLGTSYGGIVAYYMASKYPKLVEKLVVTSSGVTMKPNTNERLYKLAQVDDVSELLVPEDAKKLKKSLSLGTVRWMWWIPTFVLQDIFDWYYAERRAEKKELIVGMITGTKHAPPVPVVSQDVLILWGTKDNIFHPDLAEELEKHLGGKATLKFIKGGGHVPQIEYPRLYNKHVLSFLSKPVSPT